MKKLLLLSFISVSMVGHANNHVNDDHKLQAAIGMYTFLVQSSQIDIDLNRDGFVVLGGPSDGAICQITPEACSGNSND